MAVDKLVDSSQLDSDLTSVAIAIRTKGGTSASLSFPSGFVSAIGDISTGTDVSDTTASAGDVLSGKYFYTSDGTKTQGSIATKSSSDLTVSGATVTAPAGYYSSSASASVTSGTITNNTSGGTSEGTINRGNQIKIGAGYYASDTYYTAQANSGTKTISASGTTSVDGYENASVAAGTITNNTSGGTSSGTINRGKQIKIGAGMYNADKYYTAQANSGTKTISASGTISVDGYVNASVAAGTEGTPTATKGTVSNNSVSVTPKVTNTAGYITGGSKTGTAVTVSASELVSGTLNMTIDGISDVTKYASVNVTAQQTFLETYYTSYSNSVITKIRNGKFAFQTNLTNVSFPACKSFYDGAFYGCQNLSSVYAPLCTSIGTQVFYNCQSLTTVSFSLCTNLGNYAFSNCLKLTAARFSALTAIGASAFRNCQVLTTTSFPKVTSVNSNAFELCTSLATISFPSCVSIRASAFKSCYNLLSLYLKGSSVAALANSNAFTSTPIDGYSASAGALGKIYVPSSLLASYKAATNWTYFSARMVGQ